MSVPARVTAPEVAVAGVKPVVPALKVVTATPDSVLHCGAVPDEVRIWPAVPIASVEKALVPAPKASEPAVKEVRPVPPFATFRVPASVTAPVVAVFGVNPVVPAEKLLDAVDADASNVTTPEPFL
jgi:hypothetical protein